MSFLCYKLKVAPAGDSRVYRIFEINANRTFADLSDLILEMFDFDDSHLYMFSLKCKRYDPDGIYAPMAGNGKRADQICLGDVKPVVKNKYLYLYDFGDEWIFYVTVMEIRETDGEVSARIIEGKGNLCQYPDWAEDEFWEDEGDTEDTDDLVITVIEEADDVVRDRLTGLPALMQQMWIRLSGKDLPMAGPEELQLLCRLEEAGLVDIDETETHLYLKVKCGKRGWKEYKIWKDLEKRREAENILLSLAGLYGVIEMDQIGELFDDNTLYAQCSERLFVEVIEGLCRWKFLTLLETNEGRRYVSYFCSSIAEEILQRREKYPVKRYRILEQEARDALISGNWRSAAPVYGATQYFLFWECGWNPEDVGEFLEQLSKCVAMGYTEQEYFEWIQEMFEENDIRLTKQMRKKLRAFRNELPSAALKGYTWGEYEKERKAGYHQLSLFEEDLPFL